MGKKDKPKDKPKATKGSKAPEKPKVVEKSPVKAPEKPKLPEPKTAPLPPAKAALPAPAVAPSPSKKVETVAPVKPRDPELPPLPPPTPPAPPNPNRQPFDWKPLGKRPASRPCHFCDKDTPLTTDTASVPDNYEPKDDEGLYHEWCDTMILNVICPPCWRVGRGHNW